ncbi:MAG: exonuclease domain-containing protein, partial [Chloroflexota bacterium]|nr:exonuclease domain-containing protein [Chloroflexota bacterium]
MVLFDTDISPFEQVNVALDLETTGLDSNRHQILEVGAVRFRGDEVIETYQTLVNPGVAIPEFIQRLTHISPQQVKRAPFFSSVASEIEDFLGADPIIGHNIQFDIGFLANNGVQLNNPSYDTWDLATVFMPRSRQYSLKYLTSHFKVEHNDAHRALADAMATKNVYVKLLRLAAEQDSGLLAYLSNLASRSHWSISGILAGLEGVGDAQTSSVGLTGLDLEQMSIRLGSPEKRRADPALSDLSEDKVAGLLTKDGPFAKVFSGFEHRPEQEQMLSSVTKAMYHNQHLVVEGGTGVGKSMSYLLPSALFAISKGQRVIISTNTINLQEQLMNKDIPALTEVLEQSGLVAQGVLKAALLKGRTNYLCLRRWNHLARSDSPTIDDARLLSKTSVWMQNTTSGDRAEINLSGRDAGSWSHVSAGEKGFCPGLRDGTPCFLRAARERAEQAHIVVVNHALLLSDLARGGGLIPEYQHLIIDEAHNLED